MVKYYVNPFNGKYKKINKLENISISKMLSTMLYVNTTQIEILINMRTSTSKKKKKCYSNIK